MCELQWSKSQRLRSFSASSSLTEMRYIGLLFPPDTRTIPLASRYSDVIMRTMASQITSVSIVCSTVCSGRAPRHWPWWGEFTGDRWIPAQRANNAENDSIWWRHHVDYVLFLNGHENLLIKRNTQLQNPDFTDTKNVIGRSPFSPRCFLSCGSSS